MKLTITTGVVTIPIERDGEVTGALHFDPKDVAFAQGFYDLLSRFEQTITDFHAKSQALEKDDAAGYFALLREVTDSVRSGIDGLFGSGTAEAAFGPVSSPDVMGQFFDGLAAIVTQSREGSVSKYLPEPEEQTQQGEDGLV